MKEPELKSLNGVNVYAYTEDTGEVVIELAVDTPEDSSVHAYIICADLTKDQAREMGEYLIKVSQE